MTSSGYNLTSSVEEKITPIDEPADIEKSSKPFEIEKEDDIEDPRPRSVPWQAWCILFISCFGVFMASVSTSALVIAFPVLLADLNMTINTTMWVLLIILLMIGAVVPTAGKLGDMVGQAFIYKMGYWIFVFGSLGAGFVQKQNQGFDLIAARIVIGFGAALLFTNSSAILTNSFAPYNKVGLSQGIFQLSSAMGAILGPLIGGGISLYLLVLISSIMFSVGFSETNWRWIFWFNVPSGGLCALFALYVVQDVRKPSSKSTKEKLIQFDYLGAAGCSIGLVLILIPMIQGVSPLPALNNTGAIAGIVVAGCFCGIIFSIDQFYAIDPLIPPSIFLDRIYFITTLNGTFMAFVRNSITYNMIFFLQGPYGKNPLQAGIDLIPFGIGTMVAGFTAGAVADKVGMKNMAVTGPLITLCACCGLSIMDNHTKIATVEGLLFLAGLGIGLFQSPNATANMLSVDPHMRGVAAAVGMLTMTFCMMVGIVLTFSFVLNSMTQEQLYNLFIYGGGAGVSVQKCLDALKMDYYIVIAFCACAVISGCCLPHDLNAQLKARNLLATSGPSASSSKKIEGEEDIAEMIESDEQNIAENEDNIHHMEEGVTNKSNYSKVSASEIELVSSSKPLQPQNESLPLDNEMMLIESKNEQNI